MSNLLFSISVLSVLFFDPDIASIRAQFKLAINSESQTTGALKQIEAVGPENPLVFAYKGAFTALLAKHALNPYTKLQKVSEGCGILDASVIADPNNIEIRYLRYSTEVSIPSFLPYRSHIAQDESRIILALRQGNSGLGSEMRKEISQFMLKYAELNVQNREALIKLIN